MQSRWLNKSDFHSFLIQMSHFDAPSLPPHQDGTFSLCTQLTITVHVCWEGTQHWNLKEELPLGGHKPFCHPI